MHRVRVKMCGMTREADISNAVSLGVDAVGFIFYERSKRYITPEQAGKLSAMLPAFVDAVAVFVNPTVKWVNTVLNTVNVQYLQFHGEESAEFCRQFAKPYIKVVAAISPEIIKEACRLHPAATAILLDTPTAEHGGSGQTFDWQILPKNPTKPIILAGGLTAANVHEARQYDIFAVDVCSGVEAAPGIKDHHKMKEFVKALWGK
jgi:phosphoribosylanthranilate isomerase